MRSPTTTAMLVAALVFASAVPAAATESTSSDTTAKATSSIAEFFNNLLSSLGINTAAPPSDTDSAAETQDNNDGPKAQVIDGSQATQLMGAAGFLSPGGGLICSASQVSPEWVLTAKHCTEGMSGRRSVNSLPGELQHALPAEFDAPTTGAVGSAPVAPPAAPPMAAQQSSATSYRYSNRGYRYAPTYRYNNRGYQYNNRGGYYRNYRPSNGYYPSYGYSPSNGCPGGRCPARPGTTRPNPGFRPGPSNGCPGGRCPARPGTTRPNPGFRPGPSNGCPGGRCPARPGTTRPNPGFRPSPGNGCPGGRCPARPGNPRPNPVNPVQPNPGTQPNPVNPVQPNPGTQPNPGNRPNPGTRPGGNPRGYAVRLGSLNKSSGGVVVGIVDVQIPAGGGDIALVKLARPVNDYPMVQLTNQVPASGAQVDIYGWGRDQNERSPQMLKTAMMTMGRQSQDLRQGPGINLRRGNGLANRGDSGGPAMSGGVQVGVCSGSDFRSYSIYASVADHRQWIRQVAGV